MNWTKHSKYIAIFIHRSLSDIEPEKYVVEKKIEIFEAGVAGV